MALTFFIQKKNKIKMSDKNYTPKELAKHFSKYALSESAMETMIAREMKRLCREAFVDRDTLYNTKNATLDIWWSEFKLRNDL